MKQIFGMAKSNFDLKGAKGPKLELDFLRLVYAVKEQRKLGIQCDAFLLVMTEEIAETIKIWDSKYNSGGAVSVFVPQIPDDQIAAIKAEKNNNTEGMVLGTMGRGSKGRSDANIGKEFGERALVAAIKEVYPGVEQKFEEREFPFLVRWDFFGEVLS